MPTPTFPDIDLTNPGSGFDIDLGEDNWPNKINGVASASIAKINGISLSSIAKIDGTD